MQRVVVPAGWLHIRVFQPESLVWGCPARQSSLGSSFRLVRNHRPPYSGEYHSSYTLAARLTDGKV
jgi:hypothetical protein